ncbi:hypothetical protein [Undibacterium terreum]|uniref:Uncharacterized protein n=1 Tax=Undibacterium terreum TaxID=1224302 RepID=A0A916UNF7_9BURK|nr:hypothetical protein [Undibacterium terreum]GGC79817.1 hypothetical protein GCM10011396_28880 [Undibacterium terreum]
MKNLIHQKLDSEETGFTEHYVPIKKQHQEYRDAEVSIRASDDKARTSRKHTKAGKARDYGSTDSYAR